MNGVPATCPACAGASTRAERPLRGHSPVFSGRELWRCDACGMRFAHPMPSTAEWDAYNARYFDNAHGGSGNAEAARAFHRAINRVRANHVEVHRVGIEISRVLEIGPGLGDFAAHWMGLHPGTAYHAVEADARQREALARDGLRAHAGLDALNGERPFDLLVLSHVLEHTRDPAAMLSACRSRLRAGALVFIEVPCRDHEHKPEDEPHVLFFDREPMKQLLERVAITPLAVTYHGTPIERLRRRGPFRGVALRVRSRLFRVLEAAGMLGSPAALQGVDAEGRAAVRTFDGHREQSRPAWWLRAIGRVR